MNKDSSADTKIASDCRIMWKRRKTNEKRKHSKTNSNGEITKEQKESSSTACILNTNIYILYRNERVQYTHPFVCFAEETNYIWH